MKTLPFSATFDALAFIVEQADRTNPEVAELVPALCFCYSSLMGDVATHRVLENIPFEHFMVGWYHLKDVSDFIEVDIWGRRVFVHPITLSHLAGKQLILGTQGKRELLVAVARAD
jgi:hypothetical protein